MPEGYQESMWCIKKHMLLAKTHVDETIAKLARECDAGHCIIDGATAIEAEDGVRNIVAAEEHVTHVLSLRPDWWDKLSLWLDEMRAMRQILTMTGVPFRHAKEAPANSPEQWLNAYARIDGLIDEVDEYAHEMKQEQVICPKCIEDVRSAVQMAKGFDVDEEIRSVVDEIWGESQPPTEEELQAWLAAGKGEFGDQIEFLEGLIANAQEKSTGDVE